MKEIRIMSNIIIIYFVLNILIIKDVWSNAIDDLKSRLDKIDSFHADFIQKITNGNGSIIQESRGDLWIKSPNLFNWHSIQPDENILISDGDTLWFYNPSIKQVIASWMKDDIRNTPFILIFTRDQLINLKKYKIKKNGDNFILIPEDVKGNVNKLIIEISRNGIIRQFNIIEKDSLNNGYEFRLKKILATKVDKSKFTFIPPKGVVIDDQRDRLSG